VIRSAWCRSAPPGADHQAEDVLIITLTSDPLRLVPIRSAWCLAIRWKAENVFRWCLAIRWKAGRRRTSSAPLVIRSAGAFLVVRSAGDPLRSAGADPLRLPSLQLKGF
jgi:hypothetical protein